MRLATGYRRGRRRQPPCEAVVERIHEALALTETHLDERRGALLVRHGKGDKRREVGMDDWGWEHLHPLAGTPDPDTRRNALLRHRRTDTGTVVDPAAPSCDGSPPGPGCGGASHPTSCATPTRSRWHTKGRAQHHPTPARSHRPRHHLDLPPRDRQRRDHQHRPQKASTNDARQRRTTPLTTPHTKAPPAVV